MKIESRGQVDRRHRRERPSALDELAGEGMVILEPVEIIRYVGRQT